MRRCWWISLLLLGGCDLLESRYRVEFEDGSWREISLPLLGSEATWREGCRGGTVISKAHYPLVWQEKSAERRGLLIGGERFELKDKALYRSSGMRLGLSPDYIERGLQGLALCRTLEPSSRDSAFRLKARNFGN